MSETPSQLLLRWYRKHGRDLPWRTTRSAYHILISEIMLQQTQVLRVIEYYKRWLTRFPDWESLATVNTEELIHYWSGLGYNRRALMLREIAKRVVADGEPQTEEGWRALKGIGPYTAAAISAFAQQKRTLPIDTNIRRVLGRLLLGIPFPELTDDEQIRLATKDFLPTRGAFYDVPQALFDLATSICTKSPQCAVCPLNKTCKSASLFLSGTVAIPKRTIKQANEKKHRNKPFPDRIYRGRLLKEIKQYPQGVSFEHLSKSIDPTFDSDQDTEWVLAILSRLTKEGFIKRVGKKWKVGE